MSDARADDVRDHHAIPGAEAFIASATIEARKPGGEDPCCQPGCCA